MSREPQEPFVHALEARLEQRLPPDMRGRLRQHNLQSVELDQDHTQLPTHNRTLSFAYYS